MGRQEPVETDFRTASCSYVGVTTFKQEILVTANPGKEAWYVALIRDNLFRYNAPWRGARRVVPLSYADRRRPRFGGLVCQ